MRTPKYDIYQTFNDNKDILPMFSNMFHNFK